MSEFEGVLDGFRTYYMASGSPTITFSKNGLGVSKAAVAKLENSPFAKIMFDYHGKRLAIIKCDESEEGSTRLARGKKDGARWNSSDFVETIKQLTGWKVDNGERYTVIGEYIEHNNQPGLIFDLTKATSTTTD